MMNPNDILRIATYQGEPHAGNPHKALEKMLEVTEQAHSNRVDILCFPEVFLHGYFGNEEQAREHSISLESVHSTMKNNTSVGNFKSKVRILI